MSKKDESLRKDAFRLWCATKNMSEVARRLGIKRTLIYRWASEDSWEDRHAHIRDRLQIHMDFMKRCEDDTVVRLLAGELRFLDYIQEIISEVLLSGTIQPKTWHDVILTQKFILERREKLLALFPKGKTTPQAEVPPRDLANIPKKALEDTTIAGDLEKHLNAAITDQEKEEEHGDDQKGPEDSEKK